MALRLTVSVTLIQMLCGDSQTDVIHNHCLIRVQISGLKWGHLLRQGGDRVVLFLVVASDVMVAFFALREFVVALSILMQLVRRT